MWMWTIRVALAVIVAAGLVFMARHALRNRRWWRTPAGQHLMETTAVAVLEAAGLGLVIVSVPLPVAVFAVVYCAAAVVMVRRLWLQDKALRATAKPHPRGE